jgi:serine/threonine-protein kinase
LSGDKEQEYFSDGLADEIINALAQLPGVKVTARTSAFAFRGKEQDIRKIAEALDVRTILEGSVRRAGNRIRVTAQLINAQDGYHLWSQRYDGELADVFEVQEKIALAITGALQVQLMPESGVPQRYKPSLPAYEAYLKARHYELKLAPGSWEKAKQCYEEAIALDPKFAVAYSELAGLYSQAAALGLRPPQEVLLPMQECAQKALSLDASLPEAHSLRGLWTALFDNDWNEAERLFANAMAGNSVPPMARFFYVVFLLSVARPLEAVEQMQHALEHDPLFPLYRAYLVLGLWEAGRDEEALLEANQILELVENFPGVYNILAMYHAERGAFSEALSFAEKAHSLAPHLPQIAGLLAGLLFRTGNAARAQEILKNLGSPEAYGVPRALALSFQVQGETEKAADWLERAIDQRDTSVAGLVRYPLFKALLAGRRWPVLAKRMNLPHEP